MVGGSQPGISGDGHTVAFQATTDDQFHSILVTYDLESGSLDPGPLKADGTPVDFVAFPRLSRDGRQLLYAAFAVTPEAPGNRWELFATDRTTGATRLASINDLGQPANLDTGNSGPGWFGISGDGRTIAFSSLADNLVGGDSNGLSDVFVRGPLVGTG